MSPNVLVLNGISLRALAYHRILEELAGSLTIVTDASKIPADQRAALELAYRRIVPVDNYRVSGLVERRVMELHAETPFDRLVAVSEFDLIRAARLRERLGIPGQHAESAFAFRDKVRMKELAARAGIQCPTFRRVRDAIDVLEFVEAHGYPVVIKPRFGSGAVGTSIIRDVRALEERLSRGFAASPESPHMLEIETFVPGQMYHVDGLLQDGTIVANWPSRYVNECHAFATGTVLGSFTLAASNPLVPRLQDFAARLLAAMPTPPTTGFHIEVFHTPKDELVLCEVASRVGGPRIFDSFHTAFEVNLAEAFIRIQAGLPMALPPRGATTAPRRLGGFVLLPPRAGTLTRAPTACPFPWAIDYQLVAEVGARATNPEDPTDFAATVLLEGTTEGQMVDRVAEAAAWFERETTWNA